MKRSTLMLAVLAAVILTGVSGFVSGKLTMRWGHSDALERASQRIEQFPHEIGDWVLQAPQPLTEDAIEKLECTAYLNGEFVHRQTGERVTVSLIVGPFGPMSVHTPEVCYPLAGYGALQTPQKLTIGAAGDAGENEFWTTAFAPKELGGLPLQVYYAWYHNGHWMAPDWPRFDLGGDPALHKIQVASSYDATGKDAGAHPCYRFLIDFLPVWQEQQAER
ncbi:MAG: exosortase-associated EpsI family protein [Planctomycetales bacterium]|nr:exosortase-associated EpsI family protein [Planctomycetales bacterium]